MGTLRLNLEISGSIDNVRVLVLDREGNVLDQHDGMLRPLELAGDPLIELTRVPPEPSLYRANVSVDDGYTGSLFPSIVHLNADTQEIETITRIDDSAWYVVDGEAAVDLLRRLATVTDQIAGPMTLEVRDAFGAPVEGGLVRVYDKVAYDTDPTSAPILGVAIGSVDGKWLAPIYLPYGATYVFVITARPTEPSREVEVSL